MSATLVFLGMFLMQSVGQEPPIRHVPRVDSTFAERLRLCPGVPYLGGVSQPNDVRRSIAQALGTITAVDVHQFGRAFSDFAAVQAYLQGQLARRPRVLYRYTPWAEATPLAVACTSAASGGTSRTTSGPGIGTGMGLRSQAERRRGQG